MALEVRRDNAIRNRRRLAITAIILGIPVMMAAWGLTVWWFAGKPPVPILILPMMLWFAYTLVISYVLVERPLASYQCPQCQRPLQRAEDAQPWYRFRCEPCGVEWDLQHCDEVAGE